MVLISFIGTHKTPYFCFRYDDTAEKPEHDYSNLEHVEDDYTSLSRSAAPSDNGTRPVDIHEKATVNIYDEIHDESSNNDYTSLTTSAAPNDNGTRPVNNYVNATVNISDEMRV